jgi:hypothetical protein
MGSDGNVMAMGKSKVANVALQAEKALHSCSPRCNRRAQRYALYIFRDPCKSMQQAGVLAPFHG